MECINCTQCIDACNNVMQRLGKPPGLIRYTSQNALSGKPGKLLRARTMIYPLILVGIVTGLGFAVASKTGFDVRVIRGKGNPYSFDKDLSVMNTFSIRLVNRTKETQQYTLAFVDPSLSLEVVDETDLKIPGGETRLVPILVRFHPDVTDGDGNERVTLIIRDENNREKESDFRVLGPR